MLPISVIWINRITFIKFGAGAWPQCGGAAPPGRRQVKFTVVAAAERPIALVSEQALRNPTDRPSRRQVAFKGVRPSVRVFAEAPAASEAAKLLRLEDVKEGAEYEGTVVRL